MTIKDVLTWIEHLSPFLQGVLGSAGFAFILWASRRAFRIALRVLKTQSRTFSRGYSEDLLSKHYVHKNLVQSGNLCKFSFGHFLIFTESFRWILRGVLILVFFFGVFSILDGNLLKLLAYYLTFNCLFEAHRWLRDWSSESHIEKLDEDIKKEFFARLGARAGKMTESQLEAKPANTALKSDAPVDLPASQNAR